MLVYLISRKHVPIKKKKLSRKKDDMYFRTWIDAEGEYFDTAHFPDSLRKFPFKEGGIYILFGTVEVNYLFPTVTYSIDKEKAHKIERNLREDVSLTFKEPYPQDSDILLPRIKMS